VATSWNNLAIVCQLSGKPKEAEAWYGKAIEADRTVGNPINLARDLSNLADLLQTQGNLTAAQPLAEEALALKQTLDPAAAEIWKTYGLLAQIATQQGAAAKAQAYRRQSRQSYAAFAGSRHVLQKWEEEIQAIIAAVGNAEIQSQLAEFLFSLVKGGYGNLVEAIQRIWSGVRDEDELCDELDREDSLIVGEILLRL
jgi:tetratricopeptide (TPR) repeat protein